MIHRHLDVDPHAPIASLGLAALDDLLDRGDLLEWRPLLLAIAQDPHGQVADRVLWLCDAAPRQGTSRLWRAWIGRHRSVRQPAVATLSEVRRQRGLTQAELATRIGMSQSDLSKTERREDVKVSTLRSVLSGMHLKLELRAVDPATGLAFDLVPDRLHRRQGPPDSDADEGQE